jgi:predicted HTH transcriptional regulator
LESKRIRVSNAAADAIERAGHEFKRHEGLGAKATHETACAISRETEARIVLGVAEDDDDVLAPFT